MKTFAAKSGLVDLDEATGIAVQERYTYLFDMNTQQLDHMYVSPSLVSKAKYEHIHVNTWATDAEVTSDHDPSVALLNVCACG
jgi:predicted extracellular nuclease